ncbi:HK97 family phage prohead protease [Amycolatopsis anabasis]|uniref:HK97 family phage prohead protease n=1 Tax=Amycolatopsis anabasis TaxID=1840409 RepID=UPI00131B65B5|nr:HK97 family phage prohead protease [Amycolatopsis anabasis]
MKVKTCPVRIKAAGEQDGTDDGVFEAIVAAYNVDSVGDKIRPGAFADTLAEWQESGNPIPVLWSHMSHDPDYHIGYVEEAEEREEGLWVRARIDLDEPKARKVYRLLKGKRVRQFSFAYDIQEGGWVDAKSEDDDAAGEGYYELRKLRLYEVGPTLIGANSDTELLSVKSAIGPHSTATDDGAWDGPANEARLSNDAGGQVYRRAFAWQDPDGDPDAKSSYKFIHHNVSSDGEVGAANLQACTTGIAVLNGSRTGTTIPDADRQGVYNHLARHLRDADVEPPELKSTPGRAEAAEHTPGEKAGRVLSAKNESALRAALEKIADGTSAIETVLSALKTDEDGKAATPAEPATTDEKSAPPARPAGQPAPLRVQLAALNGVADPNTLTA